MLPQCDPEQLVEAGATEEDNAEPGDDAYLMRDGIGLEDGDDSYEGHENEKPGSLPPWLFSEFKAKVAEADARNDDMLPPLYRDHRTFWFPQPSAFFILNEGHLNPAKLYNPRFFLWDPQVLCPNGIKCPIPQCGARLVRHGVLHRPRRCIDECSAFWIIGYRYRCPNCRHPKSGSHTVTFCSWDQRILDALPPALAHEFPAYLTHRSGLAKSTFHVLRSCFQSGMGAKQFSDALRLSHLLSYDILRLQYLSTVITCKSMGKFLNQQFEPFLSFDDTSPKGYRGYVPSSQWLRDLYDAFIESHQNEINQHMSMLTANICGIDHSHKVM